MTLDEVTLRTRAESKRPDRMRYAHRLGNCLPTRAAKLFRRSSPGRSPERAPTYALTRWGKGSAMRSRAVGRLLRWRRWRGGTVPISRVVPAIDGAGSATVFAATIVLMSIGSLSSYVRRGFVPSWGLLR